MAKYHLYADSIHIFISQTLIFLMSGQNLGAIFTLLPISLTSQPATDPVYSLSIFGVQLLPGSYPELPKE